MNRDWSIAVQKASNAIVEELAFEVIREFYARQDPPIRMTKILYNSALDLTGKQKFDLVDGYGKTWEIKHDKKSIYTGNVFVELQALEHSKADYYLVFTFKPFVIERNALVGAVKNRATVQGGDNLISTGVLLPISELEALCL